MFDVVEGPAFYRQELSVERKGRPWLEQNLNLSIYNVYNRHNAASIPGDLNHIVSVGWSAGGAALQRGRNDKDFSCSVTVKRMW